MATSRFFEKDLSVITSRPPTRLRRSKSRLPTSTVDLNETPSRNENLDFAQTRRWVASPRDPTIVDLPPSRTTPDHTIVSKPSKSAIKTRHTRSSLPGLSVSTTTDTGLSTQHVSRKPTLPSLKTPSLVSGSTISNSESTRSLLYRKLSTSDRHAATERDSMRNVDRVISPAQKACNDDPFPGAIFGVSLPPTTARTAKNRVEEVNPRTARYNIAIERSGERGRHHTFQPSTITYDSSAASSSRASESPFSLLSTPTSASSYSSIMAPTRQRVHSAGSKKLFDMGHSPDYQASHLLIETKATAPIVPPELAHLNVDLPGTTRSPPRRPSRDGTMDLTDQQEHLSVVQSNLPASYTPSFKCIPPVDTPVSIKSPSGSSRSFFGFSSRSSSRQASPRIDSGVPLSPPLRSSLDKGFSRPMGDKSPDIRRRDSPMIESPDSPVKSSRFGFLSRRPKEINEGLEKPERTRKRGPAAGTGHEGYGKLGLRGRSSSIFGGGSFGRSPSADSTSSTWAPSFFSRKSNVTSDEEGQSDRSVKGRSSALSLRGKKKNQILPDSSAGETARDLPGENVTTGPEQSHVRDSKELLRASNTQAKAGIERNVSKSSSSQADTIGLSPVSAGYSIRIQGGSPLLEDGREGHWLRKNKQKPRKKSSSPSNFAHRLLATATHVREGQAENEESEMFESRVSNPKLAHYALPSGNTAVSLDDVQKVADRKLEQPRKKSKISVLNPDLAAPSVSYEKRHESILPTPPPSAKKVAQRVPAVPLKVRVSNPQSDSPKLYQAQTATSAKSPQLVDIPCSPATPKPHDGAVSRLSSVGRIPQVVSKRDRERKLPEQSFSRPFADSNPRPSQSVHERAEPENKDHSKLTTEREASSQIQPNTNPEVQKKYSIPLKRSSSELLSTERFFGFPSRHNSDLSYTSSSGNDTLDARESNFVWRADDSWSEYNGLCEENIPSTRASSQDTEMVLGPIKKAELNKLLNTPSPSRESMRSTTPRQLRGGKTSVDPLHLSSHTIQSGTTPSTFSISDYLVPEDRTSKSSNLARSSVPSLSQRESGKQESIKRDSFARPMSMSLPEAGTKDAEALRNEFAGSKSPRATSIPQTGPVPIKGEFRHAALVTSKWLSFGRVLFSPVHEEAKTGADARILVLDGLGKEWSYYCALSYPNCQFYHLGPDPTASTSDSVPNYRHVPHFSWSSAFPFPRGFFSGAILRFPKVTSDAEYQFCMSEIKRTLRPGGYLEISTIDLDLVNMGPRARKAVKNLKTRLHQADEQLSLWNQGDAFLKLLGRRGFECIQRCVVALPAAGRVSLSQDSSGSRAESPEHTRKGPAVDEEVEGPGLADLLRNKGEDGQLDEQITKTVAKVGQWWYSTCYENAATGNGEAVGNSLWTTPGLVREMERQGTSLRLLICYAQKPACAKRRTASV